MALTSGPVVEIPVYDHSNENFFAILSYDAVYLATVLKMNYFWTLSSFGEEGQYEQTKRPFSLYIAALVSDALINSVLSKSSANKFSNLVPRVFSLFNMAAAREKTLAHSRIT